MNSDVAVRTRHLRRGLGLTELGLGAAQLGNLYRATTDEDTQATVAEAWNSGVRYFDTAPHYGLGLSERRLGSELKQYPREEYVVSSKVGRILVPIERPEGMDDQGFAVPASHRRIWDFSRDGILRSIDATLTRMDLDRLDIVYLHDPDDHWEAASTSGVGALLELRDQGVVGAVGVGMNQAKMPAEFIRRADLDVVMVAGRYTLLDQSALEDLLPLALQRNVAIVAAGVYNSGLLSSDRPASGATYDYRTAPDALVERARRIAELCDAHGTNLPAAAVAFPLQHPAVVSVVLGARSASQAKENSRRYCAPPPPSLWADLEQSGLVNLPTNLRGKS